ncbi:hypothetical protein D1AOALGA4SA_12202 [Olavius algarvensis Delta 1 endosymbiont]|nr:hypothetical protein D1AOALGA4SA_12202 [Olavius algarvensis Delta 1 endosymbiont]
MKTPIKIRGHNLSIKPTWENAITLHNIFVSINVNFYVYRACA